MVHIFEVSPKVPALCKGLLAETTLEGPLTGMLSEVVAQIARLFEDASASLIHAFEVEFDPLRVRIAFLNCLVP